MVQCDLGGNAEPYQAIVAWVETKSDGQSPWEATQVAALDVLMEIAKSFGDELVGGPVASIPSVAPTDANWTQEAGRALVRAVVSVFRVIMWR
jgi:hypothetical protein